MFINSPPISRSAVTLSDSSTHQTKYPQSLSNNQTICCIYSFPYPPEYVYNIPSQRSCYITVSTFGNSSRRQTTFNGSRQDPSIQLLSSSIFSTLRLSSGISIGIESFHDQESRRGLQEFLGGFLLSSPTTSRCFTVIDEDSGCNDQSCRG